MLSVDNADFDEADALVDRVAVALADDDALLVGDGLDEALAEAEVDVACADGELVQVVFGVGWPTVLPAAPELGSLLELWLADGVVVARVTVGLGLALAVEVALVLAEALALELALLLRVPLDDVAGAVVDSVAVLDELVLVCAEDWCAETDAQDVVLPLEAKPPARPVGEAPPGVGAGELASPSVPLVLPAGLGLVKA